MGMGPTQDVGPAIVQWGTTTISEIFEEVRWTLTSEEAEVFEGVFGATPVDTIHTGYSACIITVPATRLTLATLQPLIPGGSISGTTKVEVNAQDAAVISHYDNSNPLVVKPISAGTAVANGKWLRLEHTYPEPDFDTVFNLRDQRVYGIKFKAHPDATSKLLWSVGIVSTAGLT